MVYVDEAAYCSLPAVRRTYHRKGERKVIKRGPIHGGVQAISMVAPSGRLLYEIQDRPFTAEDVKGFLERVLKRYRSHGLMVIWDGAKTHRSKEIKAFLSEKKDTGRIKLVRLPAYSPQLNVCEQVHAVIKEDYMPNRSLFTKTELKEAVEQAYEDLSKRPQLVKRFFHHPDTGYIDCEMPVL